MTPDEKELSRFDEIDQNNDQKITIMYLRSQFKALADNILNNVPASADRSAALRYLRLSMLQCNEAICHDYAPKE